MTGAGLCFGSVQGNHAPQACVLKAIADARGGVRLKTKLGPVPLIYPIPIVLVGATVNGRPNFETIGDCAVMGLRPALVCISSNKEHYTNEGILEHNAFSINVPQSSTA